MTASHRTVTLNLIGMHCPGCAANLDLDLEDLPGILSTSTHYAKSRLTVTFDPRKISLGRVVSAVNQAGFSVSNPFQP